MEQEENNQINSNEDSQADQVSSTHANLNDRFTAENITDKNGSPVDTQPNYSLIEKVKYYFLPVTAAVLICIIWFRLYQPFVIDKWNLGNYYIERALRVKNSDSTAMLLEKGGSIIKEENHKHPYHARVWHLLGKYYLLKENWDSCIYAEKKAISLGSGGIVNQVEFTAADNLNQALQNKLNNTKSIDTALQFIKDAEMPNFDNFVLDKFKAMVFSKFKQPDSSILYFKKYSSIYPNDSYVLMKISENYVRKNDKTNAEIFFKKAEPFEKNNPKLDTLRKKIDKMSNLPN